MPAPMQIAYHSGMCTTCELDSNFVHSYEALAPIQPPRFTSQQRDALAAVYEALQAVPDAERECWNDSALDGGSWERLRGLAVSALDALTWPLEPPPTYRQVSPGVWQRP